MKKVILLFVISLSILGYSQNPIQTNIKDYKVGIHEDTFKKFNSDSLDFLERKRMGVNPNQKSNEVNSPLYERKNIVNEDVSYRLDSLSTIYFNSDEIESKREYSYDENGNRTLYIYYQWDTESESFVPDFKDEYSYDENGNQTLFIPYQWDTESQSLVPDYKYEFSYDENGNLTLWIIYDWDTETQSLVPDYKNEFSYDENGNRTLRIYYQWDTESQSFVSEWREIQTYDYTFHPYYQTQKRIDKYYNGIGYKPSFKKVYSIHSESDTELVIVGITSEYDTNFNTWNELEGEELKSYRYYTKETSLSTNSLEPNSFSIYPNPTTGFLRVNSSEPFINPLFELYDLNGRRVLSKPFKTSENIDISELQPSIYIYRIIDENEVKQSGKLIKK